MTDDEGVNFQSLGVLKLCKGGGGQVHPPSSQSVARAVEMLTSNVEDWPLFHTFL